MAEEISKPLCAANKITMISSGDGDVGAAKLSGEVLNIMTRLPEAVEKLTGVSISQVTHARLFLCPSHTCHVKCVMRSCIDNNLGL